MDRLLDWVESTVSVGVRRLCCQVGIAARSFARGAATLKATAGIEIGEDLFRLIVENEGKAVRRAANDEPLELDWSAAQCKTITPSGQEVSRIYGSCDGVMVPTTTEQEKHKRRQTTRTQRQQMPAEKRRELPPLPVLKKGSDQRYKQVYVTCFYDQDKTHRLVGVTAQKQRGLGQLLRRDAARIRLAGAQERIGLIDGAPVLRRYLGTMPMQKIILDFRHLGEHVNDASRRVLGEKTQAGEQWSDQVLHAARHQGYEPLLEKVIDLRSGQRGGKRKAANQLLNYVVERREMIAYDECEQRGWDVGSGPIESMCGVTTDRIKGRGRRWDLDNAQAIMELEALTQSNLWEKYWAKALSEPN